jgi:hypothetical protein
MDGGSYGRKLFVHPIPANRFPVSETQGFALENTPERERIVQQIRKGERWRCQNRQCGSEIFVTESSHTQGGSNPRCSCGEVMKRPYIRPELNTFEQMKQISRGFNASAN